MMHWLEASAPNNVDGKLNKVVENVFAEYEKAANEGKIGCQLIFSDIGTPKGSWSEDMLSDGYWKKTATFSFIIGLPVATALISA